MVAVERFLNETRFRHMFFKWVALFSKLRLIRRPEIYGSNLRNMSCIVVTSFIETISFCYDSYFQIEITKTNQLENAGPLFCILFLFIVVLCYLMLMTLTVLLLPS